MIWHKLKNFWSYLNSNLQEKPNAQHNSHKFNDAHLNLHNETLHYNKLNKSNINKKPISKFSNIQTDFDIKQKETKQKITFSQFQNNNIQKFKLKTKNNNFIISDHQKKILNSSNQKPIVLPPKLKSKRKKPSRKKIILNDISQSLELPNIAIDLPKQTENISRLDQVIWNDCDDVYRPVNKSIEIFFQENNITSRLSPVYIQRDAYINILNHLKSDLSREQGGILFGHAYQDIQKGIYAKIINAVAAPNTFGSKAHLEFTAKTWQGIMEYAREIYPYENIVGWYHSHPNIGVFMSHTDMKTQESFFYHPWCLSIVYDPIKHEIGYFLGKEARPIRPIICNFSVLS